MEVAGAIPVEAILGVLAALASGGAITALVQFWRSRPDLNASLIEGTTEAAKGMVEAAAALVGPLQSELANVRGQLGEVLGKVSTLEAEITTSRQAEQRCQRDLAAMTAKLEVLESRMGGRRRTDSA